MKELRDLKDLTIHDVLTVMNGSAPDQNEWLQGLLTLLMNGSMGY